MSTTDTVFLIITACAISLFFLLGAVVMVAVLKLVKSIKRVVAKAEDTIESVGEATEVIKNISRNADGPLAALKVVRNIINLVHHK
jgi:hypothetical protein